MKSKFDSMVGRYLDMYKRNKIVSTASVLISAAPVSIPQLPPAQEIKQKFLPATTTNKIIWDGTPEEFINEFAPLMEKRKLYLYHKQKPDTQPIAKLLHQAFEIRQVDKSAEITESTLVSYFKKHFAEKYKTG